MSSKVGAVWISALVVAAVSPLSQGAAADSVEQFYKGKSMAVVTGFNPGGSYDTYTRLVSNTFGKYIPGNPTLVVRNMPGAGSRNAGNHLYIRAPKDGTEIGMISGIVAMDPLLGETKARFDSRKFNWIGNPTISTGVCVSWHASAVKTVDQLFKTELLTGVSGGTTHIYPLMLNEVVGTKFKMIAGYRGAAGLTNAFQNREIDAFCGNVYPILRARFPAWLKPGGEANVLMQFGLEKHANMPDVPLVMELAKTDEQKGILRLIVGATTKMGYPFLAPPDVPKDRIDALRKAFLENMKDPQLVERATKARLDLDFVGGEELQSFIEEMYALPANVVKKVAAVVKQK